MAGTSAETRSHRAVQLAVLVAALGYFVDIYDLILFSVVRVRSLQGLGVAGAALLPEGIRIINWQMSGMLLGGTAGPGPGLDGVDVYRWVRFVAGVGLAGELGAGITLVSESMRKETRGFGTTVVASVGICGAIVAVLVGQVADWRTAYVIGGGLGLALLLLRLGVLESGMYASLRAQKVARGQMWKLFSDGRRALRYFSVILVGVPIWYVVGVLITFAPELGRAMGLDPAPTAPSAVLAVYSGLIVGDFGSGFLSQVLRTRNKVLLAFILGTAVGLGAYFTVGRLSLPVFYGVCVFLGVTTGYWAVFVTVASEQFGTNIRATVTTTAPNFVRGSLVPVTLAFQALRGPLGVSTAALAVGGATLVIALVALLGLPETHGKDLDYVEL
jgi:hypothetical protein